MPSLWRVRFTAPFDIAESLAEMMGQNAVAQSVSLPPRQKTAAVELLFADEPDRAGLHAQIGVLAGMMDVAAPKLDISPMPKLDWLRKVYEDFPPLPIGRWTVHGALHRAAVPDRHRALQIDATSAFGTGEHPTTKGCLLMLDRLLKQKASRPPRRMLDIGCGSGILALAYVKATRGQAVAVDLDPDSVAIARFNARVNGVRRHIGVGLSNGYRARIVGQHRPYDLIMSNIFAKPLSLMAKDLKRHLRPSGIAILSGILSYQANQVLAAYRMQGLYLLRHMRIGEWSVLMLEKPSWL